MPMTCRVAPILSLEWLLKPVFIFFSNRDTIIPDIFRIFAAHKSLGRSRRDSLAALEQAAFFHNELDYPDSCRTLWGGIHLLPGSRQRCHRHGVVDVDYGICRSLCLERCIASQSHPNDSHRHSLSRLDRHWSRGSCRRRHLHLPWACHFLANLFSNHADRFNHRS